MLSVLLKSTCSRLRYVFVSKSETTPRASSVERREIPTNQGYSLGNDVETPIGVRILIVEVDAGAAKHPPSMVEILLRRRALLKQQDFREH